MHDDIIKFLEKINLEQYYQQFIEGGYDSLETLKYLNNEELLMLKIDTEHHRKKILIELNSDLFQFNDVRKFLIETNLEKYYDQFMKNGYNNMESLKRLNDEKLKLLQITAPHRKKILSFLGTTYGCQKCGNDQMNDMYHLSPCQHVLCRECLKYHLNLNFIMGRDMSPAEKYCPVCFIEKHAVTTKQLSNTEIVENNTNVKNLYESVIKKTTCKIDRCKHCCTLGSCYGIFSNDKFMCMSCTKGSLN